MFQMAYLAMGGCVLFGNLQNFGWRQSIVASRNVVGECAGFTAAALFARSGHFWMLPMCRP